MKHLLFHTLTKYLLVNHAAVVMPEADTVGVI